jgi:hypothetical protein
MDGKNKEPLPLSFFFFGIQSVIWTGRHSISISFFFFPRELNHLLITHDNG